MGRLWDPGPWGRLAHSFELGTTVINNNPGRTPNNSGPIFEADLGTIAMPSTVGRLGGEGFWAMDYGEGGYPPFWGTSV
jgi:hypothetical protein